MRLKTFLMFVLFGGSGTIGFSQAHAATDSSRRTAIYRFCAQCKLEKTKKELLIFSDGTSIDPSEKIDHTEIEPDIEDTIRIKHFTKVIAYMDKLGYDLVTTSTETDTRNVLTTIVGIKTATYFYFQERLLKKSQ